MRKLLLLAFLAAACFTPSQGQDTLKVTFEEAITIGLESNQDYQMLQNEQELLRTEKQAATAAIFPRVGISNSLTLQSGQQSQLVEGEYIFTSINNKRIYSGLSAELPLYNGGRIANQRKAASLVEEAGAHRLERGRQELVYLIAQQYLQVLLDEELYHLALENLNNQKEQLRQIKGFVEVGLNTLSDQYNQQSEVARLETVALNAQIKLENDLWKMAELLQLPSGTFPQLDPVDIGAIPTTDLLELGPDALYELAVDHRKDFQAQRLFAMAGKKQLAASRAGFFPQLSAFFNYNSFYTSLDQRSFSDQFLNIYPQRAIGLNLSIPIFNNYTTKLHVARGRAEMKNRELELQAIERVLYQETKLAYENFKAAIRRQASTEVQLKAATEAQLAIHEKFKLGLANFVDLAQANQQLATAQSDHAQARYTLYFQEILLKYTVGML